LKKKQKDDSCAYKRALKKVVKTGELKKKKEHDSCAYRRVLKRGEMK